MGKSLKGGLSVTAQKKLARFKEYAVSHPHLTLVDQIVMRAILEPAGFAHVLVYGPSGVGKTTMIRQIAKRLNSISATAGDGQSPQLPLLLLETRPPDGGAFNRADYYRTALKLLGENFYERRMLVDIDSEQTWEKKGRSRSKAAQFNDSPELRQALEDALHKRQVRAVILDEAQHLMKIGSGASGAKLLDQLDWIKSITNVTGVVHLLIGTYELLNLRNLSGQASRRSLDIHFPRYLFERQSDCQDFQAVLLALLKQVPLQVELETLMPEWPYFYERSIGCVGVLKDWLVRSTAAALHDGSHTLSLSNVQAHALTLPQCERMALDAVEGEKQFDFMDSRREHLWRLLNRSSDSRSSAALPQNAISADAPVLPALEAPTPTVPKRRQSRKKASATQPDALAPMPSEIIDTAQTTAPTLESAPKRKSTGRVGQRQPQRDSVGS